MSEGNVEIVFRANASQVVTATGQINSSLARTATAGDAAGRSISSGMAGAAASTSKALKALGPLGGLLSNISPEAGAAVSSVVGLAGAFEGAAAAGIATYAAVAPFLAILAPVAIGVGFVAAAMADSAERAKNATTAMAALEVAMKAVNEIATTTAEGHAEFAVTLGLVTKEEAAYNKASETLVKTYKFQNELLRKAIDLRVEAGEEKGLLDDVNALRDQQDQLFLVTKAEMKRLNNQHEYAVAVAKNDEFLRKRDKAAVEGAKAAAAAAEAAGDALKLLNDEMARQGAMAVAAESAFAGALSALAAQEKAADAAVASKAQAIEMNHKVAIAAADAYRSDADAHALTTSAKETIDAQYRETVSALDVKYYADLAALREADATAAAATAQALADEESAAQRDKTQMYASTTGAVVGSVTGLYDELLQNRLAGIDTESAAGKKAAMEVWEQQKGLAIASTTLQAIVAIAMAWASAPAPANIPAIVTSTVAGAASVAAAVAAPAPKFAAGGFPDERMITAHAGEAILSRQGRAAMGDDAIQAANAGRMDGAPAVSQIVYKHRAFDYFVADHLQLDGSLARTIRRGDRVGQLRRGRG